MRSAVCPPRRDSRAGSAVHLSETVNHGSCRPIGERKVSRFSSHTGSNCSHDRISSENSNFEITHEQRGSLKFVSHAGPHCPVCICSLSFHGSRCAEQRVSYGASYRDTSYAESHISSQYVPEYVQIYTVFGKISSVQNRTVPFGSGSLVLCPQHWSLPAA